MMNSGEDNTENERIQFGSWNTQISCRSDWQYLRSRKITEILQITATSDMTIIMGEILQGPFLYSWEEQRVIRS